MINKFTRARKMKMFNSMGGVSNNMLVSLSLAHLDSKKFNSNQSMVDFLSNNGFLNFKETSQVMSVLDRSIFLAS
jgi:protein-L-isoaspartate O-methyltransferase